MASPALITATALAAGVGCVLGHFASNFFAWGRFILERKASKAHVSEGMGRLLQYADVLEKFDNRSISPEVLRQLGVTFELPGVHLNAGSDAQVAQQSPAAPSVHTNPKLYETTYAMRQRAAARYKVLNAEMDSLLVDLELLTPAEYLSGFAKRQERWVEYRQSLIDIALAEHEGGTIAPLMGVVAAISETRRRIDFLKAEVSHWNGDASKVELEPINDP